MSNTNRITTFDRNRTWPANRNTAWTNRNRNNRKRDTRHTTNWWDTDTDDDADDDLDDADIDEIAATKDAGWNG